MLKMMLRDSNVIIFDQPLDHLDSESIDAAIEAINRYQSVAIFTTYNKALIKEANVILEINSNSSFIFRDNLYKFEEKMNY